MQEDTVRADKMASSLINNCGWLWSFVPHCICLCMGLLQQYLG